MASLFSDDSAGAHPDLARDLDALERKLASLVSHVRALRAANEALRRDLGMAQTRNRALAERVVEAKTRIDALVARLPAVTQ
ncbi:MAG: hypothetical protein ABI920_10675 [Casimicrobiaceae bacterium]